MLIGLTGGIASGKTTVANFLKELGAIVIDADEIAREVVKQGTDGYKEIVDTFGKEFLQDDGEIDRKKLGDLVFSSKENRKKINAITHPKIMKEILRRISLHSKEKNIFLVIPLLIETKMQNFFDKIWLIKASEENQIKRLIKRDNITRNEALLRINSQMRYKEKEKFADVIIDCDKPIEQTKLDVEKFYKELTKT